VIDIPKTKSAKKQLRQSERRRIRNLQRKEALKAVIKRLKRHILAGEKERAQELLPLLMKAADKAAAKGTIHKNKAARLKSRLMQKINSISDVTSSYS